MGKFNYYGLKFKTGETFIFDNWWELEATKEDIKGTQFKGFLTREEAEDWLSNGKKAVTLDTTKLLVYTDGAVKTSKETRKVYSGWAWAAFENDILIAEDSGIIENPLSRNIDSECEAAIQAAIWITNQNRSEKIIIVHDYEGVAEWAKGVWAAETTVAQNYIKNITPYLPYIDFAWVKGHSGVKGNEYVDKLAKEVLKDIK